MCYNGCKHHVHNNELTVDYCSYKGDGCVEDYLDCEECSTNIHEDDSLTVVFTYTVDGHPFKETMLVCEACSEDLTLEGWRIKE